MDDFFPFIHEKDKKKELEQEYLQIELDNPYKDIPQKEEKQEDKKEIIIQIF